MHRMRERRTMAGVKAKPAAKKKSAPSGRVLPRPALRLGREAASDFIDAASRLFLGYPPSNALADAETLEELNGHPVMHIVYHLASNFAHGDALSPRQADTLGRVVSAITAPGAKSKMLDLAYWRGVNLVLEYAPRVQQAGSWEEKCIHMVQFWIMLAANVDLEMWGRTRMKKPDRVALLESFSLDPRRAATKGRRTAASILAEIVHDSETLGHTRKRSVERIRRDIAAGVDRYVRKRTGH